VRFVLSATATAIALPAQTLTTLYSFNGTDGDQPNALIQGSDGDLYGATVYGGANCLGLGCGTIFKITLSGTLRTIHSFDDTDGQNPNGLVQATAGDFHGTTGAGSACIGGCGTIFKITPGGTLTTLYTFCSQVGCADGGQPTTALVQGAENLYGTTFYGGAQGAGTVFKISASGTLTTLHSFCAQSECSDGYYPTGALIQATDGDFYGTTEAGGAQGYGTVYKLTSSGTLTTLHSFDLSDGGTRKPVSFKPPTATSTGQRQPAGPTVTLVRSSKSRRAVR